MSTRGSSKRGVRYISPLSDFLRTEAAGGVLLVVAALVALLWANLAGNSYRSFWSTEASVALSSWSLHFDFRHWVNDGLMTLFFLVVGLEIKRELSEGELREPRRAALPFIAALGGMLVPAAIYTAVNLGTDTASGWAIPMATDIAMAVGVLTLLGSRVPSALKLFLLAFAIVDDIGSVLVIALFYGKGISGSWAMVAGVCVIAMVVARRLGLRSTAPYVSVGVVLWYSTYRAGIHPTLAGVVCGLLAPSRPFLVPELVDATQLADVSSYDAALETTRLAKESVSVLEWLEHRLVPWSSYLVVPVFALANAGIPVSVDAFGDVFTGRVGIGVVLGLLIGKSVGITVFSWLGVRAGLAVLPDGVDWRQIFGVAMLGGIGFTVSLFISSLAFDSAMVQDRARLAILIATVVAALLGTAVLLARQNANERKIS
jgi:Na+:H+ antiporter, NhaA family